MKAHFNALRNNGGTVSQVNKSIKVAKAIFGYAFGCEYVASNIIEADGPIPGMPGLRSSFLEVRSMSPGRAGQHTASLRRSIGS